MTRKECYAIIAKSKDLQADIKKATGKNYTNCTTAVLVDWCTPKDNCTCGTYTDQVLVKLLTVLKNKKILIKSEIDYITGF